MMRIRWWVSCAIIALLAGHVPVAVHAQDTGGGGGFWSMFRYSAVHQGRAPVSGPDQPALDWSAALSGLTYSSAAVAADGTIFVGSDGLVYSFSADGSLRWATRVGGYVISSPALGVNGLVYLGCRDRFVYALNAETGAIAWRFETGDEVWSSPTIGRDGTVYVGSFDGHLYALNPNTGAERWRFFAAGEVGASPAIDENGTIYVGSMSGLLYAIRPSGQQVWQQFVEVGTELASSPAIHAGRVYVGSIDGSLYAFNAATGERIWRFTTEDEIIGSPAIGVDGTIYIGSTDGALYAVDASGEERWRVATNDGIISSPAVDLNGIIYVGGLDALLYAIDPEGEVVWTYRAGSPIWTSPALDPEGALLFSTTGTPDLPGRLHRVNAAPFSVSFPEDLEAGQAAEIVISRPRTFSPTAGTLFYRSGGSREYDTLPISVGPVPEFTLSIPAEAVTLRGLEYYVSLTDGRTTTTLPVRRASERPFRAQVRVQEAVAPLELRPRQYQMTSVPLLLDESSAAATFGDDYGPADPAVWRLFAWANDGYQSHPQVPLTVTPGAGFLLVTQSAQPFDFGPGWSMPTNAPVSVRLQPGWNLIGNPFAFPVSFDEMGGAIEQVSDRAYFDGREMRQDESSVAVLRPYEGLFVRSRASTPVILQIPPIEAEEPVSEPVEDVEAGMVQVSLMGGDGRPVDTQNWIGFRRMNDSGPHPTYRARAAERPDLREAPSLGSGLRLSILHEGERYARLLHDSEGGAAWLLEVRNEGIRVESGRYVTLRFAGEAPTGTTMHLVHAATGVPVPLVGDAAHVPAPTPGTAAQYLLAIGDTSYVETLLPAPAAVTLHPIYPNPFSNETTIAFSLAEAGPVKLEIFDVLGRRVRTLVNEARDAAPTEVRWNGSDDTGRLLPSGTYFYRLETAAGTDTRSLTILR